MSTELVMQTAFSAGELSPHLHDRIDLEAYSNGCAYLQNFVPLPHGPIVRRRGSYFIGNALNNDVRLISFSFNLEQTFVLEFTNTRVRVIYKDAYIIAEDGSILEVSTTYTTEDLPNIRYAQYGDWLYIVDGRNTPKALKRYGNTDWRLEDLEFTNKPEEWVDENQPKHIALFEQRAYYAGTAKQPQQVWASRTGIYENFTYNEDVAGTITVLDDHGFTYTIFSNDANGIQWVLPMGALIFGTSGAEFKMGSTSAIDPVTPKNVRISVQTNYGSAAIQPTRVGSSIMFIQRSKNRLRSFEYSFTEDQYTASDLTIYADHILSSPTIDVDMQSAPNSYIWMINEKGELIGCTYEKGQKVLAWHRHDLGGKIVALCVSPNDGNDLMYVAVQRTINGELKTYIELLDNAWEPVESIQEAHYVDSGLVYEGEPTNSLVGLGHLEGMTVSVLMDGYTHPDRVVTNGKISLQQKASKIHIGLPYTSTFVSLVPQSQGSISIGKTRRINKATIALGKSLDFKYKVTDLGQASLDYNGPTPVMDKAKELNERHEQIVIDSISSKRSQLQIWQDKPLPLVIRGIVYQINPSMI